MGNFNGRLKTRNHQLERITNELKSKSIAVSKDLEMDQVYWEPIDWINRFKTLEFQSKIDCINLRTCSIFRALQNTYLADLLIYSHHSSKIKDFMLEAMNEAYEKFMETWTDFNGNIAIYGYSLGGVIAYDLLSHEESRKKLKFKPDILFNVGAPVASFLVVRDQEFYPNAIPPDIRFFNIFNPHDPLAFRLEPLMDLKMINLDPVPIENPLKESWILSRVKSLFQSMFPAISSSDSDLSSKESEVALGSKDSAVDKAASSQIPQDRKRIRVDDDIQDNKRTRYSPDFEHNTRLPRLYSLDTDELSVTGSDEGSLIPPGIKDRIDFVLEESHVYPYLNSVRFFVNSK